MTKSEISGPDKGPISVNLSKLSDEQLAQLEQLLSRLPSLDLIRAEKARRSLHSFLVQAWPIICPGVPFVDNWHLQAICEHLEAVTRGQIRNLLINVPPRTSKSTVVSVVWPAWVWVTTPERNWLYTSHSQRITTRDSIACRLLLESSWYQSSWPGVVQFTPDQNEKTRYTNTRRGTRIAISTRSGITGEGGDVLVVDDPHAVDDSAEVIQATTEWFDTVLSTRGNDPKNVAKVIIMQRVSDGDLSAHVLRQGGWEHLNLPMEYEPERRCITSTGWSDPRTEDNELLWPSRFGRAEVDSLKKQLGSFAAAAQMQQRPAPKEGGVWKRTWFRFYRHKDLPVTWDEVIASWDCSFKDLKTSDYVVGQVWGRKAADRYLLDQIHERLDFPGTLRKVRDLNARWPMIRATLVEDKANGSAVIQVLRREIPGILAVNPDGGKEARASAVAPQIEAGNVWLPHPEQCPWVEGYLVEATTFPNAPHDDRVDATSQALTRLGRKKSDTREVVYPR